MMNVYREIFADFKQGELAQFYRLMYPELMVYANRLLAQTLRFLPRTACRMLSRKRDSSEKEKYV